MSEDDFLPPATQLTLSRSVAAGIAGLLIGCTLLVSACVLMVFNVILFTRGLRGIPQGLAQIGAAIGLTGVAFLGLLGVVLGLRSWGATRQGESRAMGVAATCAGIAGLIAWLIAAIDLIMILFD
jgi:hypothetical protein